MSKPHTYKAVETFEFDSRSLAHQALLRSRSDFLRPQFRGAQPDTSEPASRGKGLERLLSAPFEKVQVRDDLGCGFHMLVDVPRWQQWIASGKLPLLLITIAAMIGGAFALLTL
jgi:hypothetical protein